MHELSHCSFSELSRVLHCISPFEKLYLDQGEVWESLEVVHVFIVWVHCSFPLNNVQHFIDVYSLSICKPMNVCSCNVSMIQKEACWIMLKDESSMKSNKTTKTGRFEASGRSEGPFWKHVTDSLKCRLNFCRFQATSWLVKNRQGAEKIEDYFTGCGVIGRGDAKDYENVDMMQSIMNALSHWCWHSRAHQRQYDLVYS